MRFNIRLFHAKIKVFCSDNGMKCGQCFLEYFDFHRPVHQTNCVNTSTRNEVFEIKNRHLLEFELSCSPWLF